MNAHHDTSRVVLWAGSCASELQLKVNCRPKILGWPDAKCLAEILSDAIYWYMIRTNI